MRVSQLICFQSFKSLCVMNVIMVWVKVVDEEKNSKQSSLLLQQNSFFFPRVFFTTKNVDVQKEEDLQYCEKRECILLANDLFLSFNFFLHTSLEFRNSGADPTVMPL